MTIFSFQVLVFFEFLWYMRIVKRVEIESGDVRPPTMCWDWVWRCL